MPTESLPWSDPESDPLADILEWVAMMEAAPYGPDWVPK